MKPVEAIFGKFCKEHGINEEAHSTVRHVFYAEALAMYMLLEKSRKKKDLLSRLAVTKEMKEFLDGKN